jgi:hypothetical protein
MACDNAIKRHATADQVAGVGRAPLHGDGDCEQKERMVENRNHPAPIMPIGATAIRRSLSATEQRAAITAAARLVLA